jgi:hypothetical protein
MSQVGSGRSLWLELGSQQSLGYEHRSFAQAQSQDARISCVERAPQEPAGPAAAAEPYAAAVRRRSGQAPSVPHGPASFGKAGHAAGGGECAFRAGGAERGGTRVTRAASWPDGRSRPVSLEAGLAVPWVGPRHTFDILAPCT